MKIEKLSISHYRSIESICLNFPDGKPLVLFGPNNAGKSNILSAIDRLLGDRYPSNIDMLDSDYFLRKKDEYPIARISCQFSEPLYYDRVGNGIKTISVKYSTEKSETMMCHGDSKIYPTNEQRANFQSCLITAERDVQSAFNYSSKYSILSKFSHKIHDAITSDSKEKLSEVFCQIKHIFEESSQFKTFFNDFSRTLENSVKGFVHSLSVDFSAYDPNNYARSLRIYAKEGDEIRGFEEFGTGEQQVLLMAFIKAYMQTFTKEHFLLIIEEPEAHLHPLAQKWLKEHIENICQSGIQVVVSTHSSAFLEPEYLDSLVRVYKENNITKIKQLSKESLAVFCRETGAKQANEQNVIEFFATKFSKEQLNGLFAEKVLLVEGDTEIYALPEYFKHGKFSFPENGIEIVKCGGKSAIPLCWRLYEAYGIKCFTMFDTDGPKDEINNKKFFDSILGQYNWNVEQQFLQGPNFICWKKDLETYLREEIDDYIEKESFVKDTYSCTSKPSAARAVARRTNQIPEALEILIKLLKTL